MIFVTVGTHKFDALVKKVDQLVLEAKESDAFSQEIVFQIGSGEYEPKSGPFFRYKPGLAEDLEKASLVITHGGTGSVLSMTKLGKPFVAIVNDDLADNHQKEFLEAITNRAPITWFESPSRVTTLSELLTAKAVSFEDLNFGSLTQDLNDFLSPRPQS